MSQHTECPSTVQIGQVLRPLWSRLTLPRSNAMMRPLGLGHNREQVEHVALVVPNDNRLSHRQRSNRISQVPLGR